MKLKEQPGIDLEARRLYIQLRSVTLKTFHTSAGIQTRGLWLSVPGVRFRSNKKARQYESPSA